MVHVQALPEEARLLKNIARTNGSVRLDDVSLDSLRIIASLPVMAHAVIATLNRLSENDRMLKQFVQRFIAEERPKEEQSAANILSSTDIHDAIEKSTARIAPHQRQSDETLKEWRRALVRNSERLTNAKDFDELYRIAEEVGDPIWNIGPLAIYDFVSRISIYLKISPRHVYLHAGPAKAARCLGITDKKAPKSAFPPELAILSEDEIESFLCIFADEICGRGEGGRRKRSS